MYEFTALYAKELSLYNNTGSSIENFVYYVADSAQAIPHFILISPIADRLITNLVVNLRVSEWNIGYWNNGVKHSEGNPYGIPNADIDTYLPRVKSLLTKICAEILVITEWVTYLDQNYTMSSYDTVFKQFYPYQYSRGNNYPTIYSKYPITGSVGTFITAGGTYSKGIINVGGKEIVIVAVHLPSREQDREIRIQMMSDIVTEYADSPYVIFVGDTNIYNLDELQPFITAEWSLGNGGYFGNIDTWYTGTWYIDNVITKGISIDNFEKIEDDLRAGISDHYPVASKMSLLI